MANALAKRAAKLDVIASEIAVYRDSLDDFENLEAWRELNDAETTLTILISRLETFSERHGIDWV